MRRTLDGAKTLSLRAGWPGVFWSYAMRAYCFAQNIDIVDGDSAWNKRHDHCNFEGPTIPFGCLIDFKPQPEAAELLPKGSPDSVPGIFLGSKLLPGGLAG